MDDRIELRGLRVSAFCGVLPEEKARRQPFEVDLDVHADLSTASASDDLADTIDVVGRRRGQGDHRGGPQAATARPGGPRH